MAKSIATKLKTATTDVNVAAATAPTSGQVLTATSSTAATWQTPGAGGGAFPYQVYSFSFDEVTTVSSCFVYNPTAVYNGGGTAVTFSSYVGESNVNVILPAGKKYTFWFEFNLGSYFSSGPASFELGSNASGTGTSIDIRPKCGVEYASTTAQITAISNHGIQSRSGAVTMRYYPNYFSSTGTANYSGYLYIAEIT